VKINVTKVLLDLEGKPLRVPALDTAGERDLTLRKVCTDALQAQLLNDAPDGEEKFKRFQLAMLIMSSDEPDLKAEELTKLKRLIGLGFSSTVVGRAYEILDPTPSASA
jgi:hypothetical protein